MNNVEIEQVEETKLLGVILDHKLSWSKHIDAAVVHHGGQAYCHPGPLYQLVSEEGPKNGQRLQPPWS